MEKLPIYPVETFPDRPAFIVPAIGEAYDAEDVSRAIADAGYTIRQDLEPEVTDTPGAEGWYVFVEGQEEHLGSSLGASKKKKKGPSKKEKALARKSAKGGARRRKTGGGGPRIKKFRAKGFNLKKMPLGIATQLIFAQIWPDAYKVSHDFPQVKFGPEDPAFMKDMDFNPHLYLNVQQAMEWSREGQADSSWKELAADCADTGEPPYEALFVYAHDTHGHGKSIERQIMETFDFPIEAQALMVRYERDRYDEEAHEELWQDYFDPYFNHLAYILDLMKTPEMTGYFRFTSQPYSEEWGLYYEECSGDRAEGPQGFVPMGPYAGDDDDEDDMDEPEPPEEPVGGDLNEP